MLKYDTTDITFSEVPDEISLTISITNCKGNCPGCHSPHLRMNIGNPLYQDFNSLIEKYRDYITCICFLGEGAHEEIEISEFKRMCFFAHELGIKTCLYSGRDITPEKWMIEIFDFIKVGSYNSDSGPINKETTNQIMYEVKHGELNNITNKFWRKIND